MRRIKICFKTGLMYVVPRCTAVAQFIIFGFDLTGSARDATISLWYLILSEDTCIKVSALADADAGASYDCCACVAEDASRSLWYLRVCEETIRTVSRRG